MPSLCEGGFMPHVTGALSQSADALSLDLAQWGQVIKKIYNGSEIKGYSGLVVECPDGHADWSDSPAASWKEEVGHQKDVAVWRPGEQRLGGQFMPRE